jgi:hypothetical protein
MFLILHNLIEFWFESYLEIAKKIINIDNLNYLDLINIWKIIIDITKGNFYETHKKYINLINEIDSYVSNWRNSWLNSKIVYSNDELSNIPNVNELIDLYITANNKSQSIIKELKNNKFHPDNQK